MKTSAKYFVLAVGSQAMSQNYPKTTSLKTSLKKIFFLSAD